MSKTPKFDAKIAALLDQIKVEERTCELTGRVWRLTEDDLAFFRLFKIPVPVWHPEIYLNYLNGFNTGLAIFWNKDVIDGQNIISAIHPDNPIPVCSAENFSKEDYASIFQEVDSSKSLFDLLWIMIQKIPCIADRNINTRNTVGVANHHVVDSYIACGNFKSRNVYYSYGLLNGEDSIDCVNSEQVSNSYHVTGSQQINDCQFIFESSQCQNSSFLFDCRNCEFCFGATNKRNKKYLWWNEQLSKEEWEKRRSEVNFSDHQVVDGLMKSFYELWRQSGVWPDAFGYGNTEAWGERVFQSVRCQDVYWQIKTTDTAHSRFGMDNQSCFFNSGEAHQNQCCFSTGGTESAHLKFCLGTYRSINLEYCHNCHSCENCFACIGLRYKKFHILNKEYSEDEYWQKVDEIKCAMLDRGEYGKFFPAKFSPNGFQYSVGEVYFGYSDQDLKQFEVHLFDPKRGQILSTQQATVEPMLASDLPDRLLDFDQTIHVGKPILDANIGRTYSILPAEFQMYKDHDWPAPKKHFVTRITDLLRHSNSPIITEVLCAGCQEKITSYVNSTFRERRILCKSCYLRYLEEKG